MDQGLINSAFNKVQTFADAGGDSAKSLTHVLTAEADNLVIGRIYSFKFRSANSVGYSDFSELLRVGIAD
jgi:hypothetical protein